MPVASIVSFPQNISLSTNYLAPNNVWAELVSVSIQSGSAHLPIRLQTRLRTALQIRRGNKDNLGIMFQISPSKLIL